LAHTQLSSAMWLPFKGSPRSRVWPLRRRNRRPGSLQALEEPRPRSDLESLSLIDLTTELLARLNRGASYERDKDLVIAGQLQDVLDARLNVHLNRFAPSRFRDILVPILERLPQSELQGATIVDLGSGSLNPLVFGFLLLMLGAERAYSVDLEPAQDLERAVRALATAAGWLLVDPTRITGAHAITARTVLENLRGFDLPKLAAGHRDGICSQRLIYRIESVYELGLEAGEADVVFSVSLLEHLDRIDDALDSLRSVTKRGGAGHHVVDFMDHRVYTGEVTNPLDFLKIQARAPLVHGCNRIRCRQLCSLFERHGFVVEHVDVCQTATLHEDERRQFVDAFRSMTDDDLTPLCARIFVRRR
jgi:SAM-dependent methyltransferase